MTTHDLVVLHEALDRELSAALRLGTISDEMRAAILQEMGRRVAFLIRRKMAH